MPDAPPKRKRGRPRKTEVTPDPSKLGVDDMAAAEAAAAKAIEDDAKPLGDTPPSGGSESGGSRPRRKRVSKQMTQQIEDGLAEILQIPAVPATILGDAWAAQHFTNQGRAFANRIAVVSERNPVLRGWCERAIEGESIAVLFVAGLMYMAPPMMHLGVLPGGEMLGIPVLRRQAPEPIVPPAPEHEPVREAPAAQQYGGSPTEVPDHPPESAPTVAPAAHFVGGSDNGSPPEWKEEMLG
jgi:hypothetical protein